MVAESATSGTVVQMSFGGYPSVDEYVESPGTYVMVRMGEAARFGHERVHVLTEKEMDRLLAETWHEGACNYYHENPYGRVDE